MMKMMHAIIVYIRYGAYLIPFDIVSHCAFSIQLNGLIMVQATTQFTGQPVSLGMQTKCYHSIVNALLNAI